MSNPTGRKSGAQALVTAAVIQAGPNGMSTEEIRERFPELVEGARKGAINAAHRGLLKNMRSRRLTVYYPPSVSAAEMRANFAERSKVRDAQQAELRSQRKARYLEKLSLDEERRRQMREAAEEIRAQRRAEVERQKKEREALRAQQKAQAEMRKRTLKAETALNNRLAKRIKGTTRGLVTVPDVSASEDWSQARVTKAKTPLGRWEVGAVTPLFSALRPGQYLSEAA